MRTTMSSEPGNCCKLQQTQVGYQKQKKQMTSVEGNNDQTLLDDFVEGQESGELQRRLAG